MKLPPLSLLFQILLSLPLFIQAANNPPVPSRAPNWYDVEMIVFRYTEPSAGSLERWPANPTLLDWGSAVPLNPTGSGLPYMQLAASSFRLGNDWQKLIRSSDYQPLLQVAWTQPAIDRASALFVRIGTPATAATPADTATIPAAVSHVAVSHPETGTPVYGTARLSTTGPYLHFDLDLVYRGPLAKASIPDTAPASDSATAMPQFQWYQLLQDRRIDAGKPNYFDQPLFGVLILVTPNKTP